MEGLLKRKRWVLISRSVFWALLILVLCLMPSEDVPNPGWTFPHLDKLVHFGLFLVLAFFLCAGLADRPKVAYGKIWFIVITLSFLYGGIIELLQANFFNRSGDVWDLAADVAGAVVGCLLYPVWHKAKKGFLSRFGT